MVSCHSVTSQQATLPSTSRYRPSPTEVTLPPKSTEVTTSSRRRNASVEASESGILPNTGGPEGVLLIGGVALLAVGGAAVVVARRRQNH